MRQIIWLGFTVFMFLSCSVFADTELTQRKDVQQFINKMVKEHHFKKHDLIATLNQAKLQPQIIESMEKPYEKKTWDIYRGVMLTPQRLKGGLDFWRANQTLLQQAQRRYGVPPEIIIAILGVETLYGERQGSYRVLDALSTLAFNYPPRSAFFTKELGEYLLLCREHHVPATNYVGSYAGAIGKPQFMPSSYRFYAVDAQHKGTRDLVTNNADVIFSIANYLHRNGWKLNEGIAQHAQLTGSRYRNIQVNPKRANYNYTQLITAGIKPVTAAYNHPKRAGIIELITAHEGNEYWMAYPNFFVIMRYNASPQYAMAVYLLSQQLKAQWVVENVKHPHAYV